MFIRLFTLLINLSSYYRAQTIIADETPDIPMHVSFCSEALVEGCGLVPYMVCAYVKMVCIIFVLATLPRGFTECLIRAQIVPATSC